MAQCYYCNSSLPASGDVVTCFGCNNKFHFGCSLKESTYRRMSEDERKKWRCFHVCKNSKGATGIASPGIGRGNIPLDSIRDAEGLMRCGIKALWRRDQRPVAGMELNEAVVRLQRLLVCAESCGVPRYRLKKRLQSLGYTRPSHASATAVVGCFLVIIAVGYSLGLHTKSGFTRVWFNWNHRRLNDHMCTIRMPDVLTRAVRPPEDCQFCRDVSAIDIRDNLDPKEFEELYAYTSRPVVVSDGTLNWTAQQVFSFDYFKHLYKDSAEKSVCQFFPYDSEFRTLSEVFNMSKERATMNDGTKPWYVGWSNCDGKATDSLRQHYDRPYFLPVNAENNNIDWIFMGSPGYGAKMHVDNVNLPSWQAQLRGKKKWSLQPPPECLYQCKKMSIVVEPGQIIVLDTNKWYHETRIVSQEMSITIGAEYD